MSTTLCDRAAQTLADPGKREMFESIRQNWGEEFALRYLNLQLGLPLPPAPKKTRAKSEKEKQGKPHKRRVEENAERVKTLAQKWFDEGKPLVWLPLMREVGLSENWGYYSKPGTNGEQVKRATRDFFEALKARQQP